MTISIFLESFTFLGPETTFLSDQVTSTVSQKLKVNITFTWVEIMSLHHRAWDGQKNADCFWNLFLFINNWKLNIDEFETYDY